MFPGLHEWPLILFTVISQCVIGTVIAVNLPLISGSLPSIAHKALQRNLFFAWVLMGIAMLLSLLHLGSPLRAINSLNQVGYSSLSNEILASVIFFAVGGLYWLTVQFKTLNKSFEKLWLLLCAIAGIGFLCAMISVYKISTVPTWNSAFTNWSFCLTFLLTGSFFASVLMLPIVGLTPFTRCVLPLIAIFAFIASLVLSTLQIIDISQYQSSITSALLLIPNLGSMILLRALLISVGFLFWFLPLLANKTPPLYLLILSLVLILCGEFIGRGIFYGLHMTMGITLPVNMF